MKSEKITDFCVINENEIAIHYDEDSFFGNTAFLMFFDIKNNEQIKTLKLIYRLYRENANDINDICLINDNYLSINYYDGFRIIYIKNGKLIEEIYSNLIECHLFQLNLIFFVFIIVVYYKFLNLKIMVELKNINIIGILMII